MSISPISSNLVNFLSSDPLTSGTSAASDSAGASNVSFADVLSDSLKTVEDTDTADKVSALELLAGQSDDLSGLMLDSQKAELSLNLALQIRNKVIDAYNEIMRMQV